MIKGLSKFISLYVRVLIQDRQGMTSFKLNSVYRHKMSPLWLCSGPRNCAAVEECQSLKYTGKQVIGCRLSELQ